jgi:hypothetical protein
MTSEHKITPTNPRLSSLLADVTRGNIKIPVFQREFVWSDEQIMSLLDSIYRGYPVGSLLLWSTKESLDHERNIGGFELPVTPEDYPVNYLLDGQQRLTTLYGVFNSDSRTTDSELADRFNVCFSPVDESFIHHSEADPALSINLRVILDTTKLLPELARFNDSYKTVIARLTERFKDYEFPVVTIKDRTNQEVCRVFQRINSSGTKLSNLELLAAWTWSDQFDLRSEIETLLDRLSEKGYEDLDETLLMRCLSSIVLGSIEADELVDAEPTKLIEGMATLKQAMYATIDFLEKELQIKNVVFLPFPIMIVPLVKFYSITLRPDAVKLKALRKWFWFCSFSQRYKAGTNKLVMIDLENMKSLADGKPIFDDLDNTVDSSIFKRTWRINSTVAKAAICLLAQFKPRSFLTGMTVDLSNSLAAYNAREFHHIYPKAFLSDAGIGFHEANVIANICLLTSNDNNLIKDRNPAEYFRDIQSDQKDQIMNAALIPLSVSDGSKPFAEFIRLRAETLSKYASELIRTG